MHHVARLKHPAGTFSEFHRTSGVLIKRYDKAILQLGYFIGNLEQHTLDENKVEAQRLP